jgi:molybdate transport system substrate-binding protein
LGRSLNRLVAALLVLGGGAAAHAEPITVSVAASFKDVMEAIATDFKASHSGVDVTFNVGGSGMLARQIEDGAPVDVFVSAGWPEIDRLRAKGLVAGEPVVVARNRLVVVVPATSSWLGKAPRALFESPTLKQVALGDPASVPFGAYAKQALTAAGLWDAVAPKAVYAADVRQALTYADQGAVDAAVVYATDVPIAKSAKLLGEVHGGDALKIEAPAARLARSTAKAAPEFVTFLTTGPARDRLRAFGFVVPGP